MRRRLALLTSLALLVGLAPVAAQAIDLPGTGPGSGPMVFAPAGSTGDRFPVATAQRVDVTAHDGIALHARVFRPDTSSDPAWKTPVILVHSPYYDGVAQGSPDRSLDLVQRFTPKGYTVVLSDLRGTGNSGGCGEQDGANQARDFRTLVEHFAAQPWSNGKVGSYGKSYDAESQKAGAVLQPRGLETMVVVAGISSLYDVAYFDGVPLRTNGAASAAAYELYDLDVPGEQSALPRRAERTTCQPANFVNGADPSGDETSYWAERDFRPGVARVQASVLEVQGLSDFTVAPIQLDGWFDALPTFKRAVVGQWAHNYPYDTTAALARDDWYDSVHAWFDAELLDLDTGTHGWPAVQVQDEKGVWRAVPSHRRHGRRDACRRRRFGSRRLRATHVRRERLPGPPDRAADRAAAPVRPGLPGRADHPRPSGRTRGDDAVGGAAAGTARTLTRGYLSAAAPGDPDPWGPGHAGPRRPPPGAHVPVRQDPRRRLEAAADPRRLRRQHDPGGTAFTATLGAATLRLPVAQEQCGLAVRTRQAPRAGTPDCPDGVPAEAPRYVPDAAEGHAASATASGATLEKVGGVDAVRQSGYLTVRDGVQLAYEVVRPTGPGRSHPVHLRRVRRRREPRRRLRPAVRTPRLRPRRGEPAGHRLLHRRLRLLLPGRGGRRLRGRRVDGGPALVDRPGGHGRQVLPRDHPAVHGRGAAAPPGGDHAGPLLRRRLPRHRLPGRGVQRRFRVAVVVRRPAGSG